MNTASLALIGTTELILVLVIVVLLFGVGKLSDVGKQLGAGIRNFKSEIGGNDAGTPGQLPPAANASVEVPRDVTDEAPRT